MSLQQQQQQQQQDERMKRPRSPCATTTTRTTENHHRNDSMELSSINPSTILTSNAGSSISSSTCQDVTRNDVIIGGTTTNEVLNNENNNNNNNNTNNQQNMDYTIYWYDNSNYMNPIISHHEKIPTNNDNNNNSTATTTTTSTSTTIQPDRKYHIAVIHNNSNNNNSSNSTIHQDAIMICIKGYGCIENISSVSSSSSNNSTTTTTTPTTTTSTTTPNPPAVVVQGYHIPPNNNNNNGCYIFDSASWSSWITITIPYHCSIRITSNNNNNPSTNSHTTTTTTTNNLIQQPQPQPQQQLMIYRTFDIYNVMDRIARPTIIPQSWQYAIQNIIHDMNPIYCTTNDHHAMNISNNNNNNNNNNDNNNSPLLQYTNLSFFQDSVHDSNDNSNDDIVNDNNHTDPNNMKHQYYNWKQNDGYQIMFCGAKGVGKSTCLRYCLNQLLNIITNTIIVLDIDLGQPEYTLPGMMQLTKVVQPNFISSHMNPLYVKDPSVLSTTSSSTNNNKNNTVMARYYFGSIVSETDPTTYTKCVALLLNKYIDSLSEYDIPPPLLINLDGWTKDMGYEILTAFIHDTFQLRHVIQISGTFKSKILDLSMVVQAPCTLHECYAYDVRPTTTSSSSLQHGNNIKQKTVHNIDLDECDSSTTSDNEITDADNEMIDESQKVTNTTEITNNNNNNNNDRIDANIEIIPVKSHIPAVVLRDVRLITYFIQVGYRNNPELFNPSSIWDTIGVSYKGIDDASSSFFIGNTLASAIPYVISIDAIDIRFTIPEIHHDIPPNRYFDVINGMIVGLCTAPNNNHTISPVLYNCLGLGIVRAVDRQRRLLYLLTPLDQDTMQFVNCLTVGSNLHLPLQCYFRGAYTEDFPYLGSQNLPSTRMVDDTNTPAVPSMILGNEPMKSRNNINRRGRVSGIGS